MNKLTNKQKLFCKEYLVDLNATKSAMRAGYSKRNANKIGSQLLGKTRIAEKIQKNMNKRAEKAEITAEYVLSNIQKVYDRCMAEAPVLDKEGNETGMFQFRDTGALKALEMLGKHLKLFSDTLIDQSKHQHYTVVWEKYGKDEIQAARESMDSVRDREQV